MSAERARGFVDTNILLYAYDSSAGERHVQASALVGDLAERRAGALSVQVLQEFYVNATRNIAQRLDHGTALARVRALSRWPVHAPAGIDVLTAAELAHDAQLSFWDAMILVSAQAMGCGTLWSEDLNDGQRVGGVTIRNPFAPAGG
ncbi:MAG TPA: PIN domain-containing protein [Nocardioidaceae bacterium]|nr:PIN domain-containing protein [Nocardioidaceae bacterium]